MSKKTSRTGWRRRGVCTVFLVALLTLFGCGGPAAPEAEPPEQQPSSDADAPSASRQVAPAEAPPPQEPEPAQGPGYIEQVVQATIARFAEPGMSEYQQAKAAFDYMIGSTNLTDPIGLELWRVRGSGDPRTTFVENRSLSVLLYGIGMCEDYAAAFTMLLRGMGLEAEYVPGLTYAANGTGFVDHAWTIAKIDGAWYHLDPQLEDNISRHSTIRYKYFMRGDATMSGSHRWGQNLIDSGFLTAEQNEEIARDFLYAPCPRDYPTPAPQTFTPAEMPDVDALRAEIAAEINAYKAEHGPLEPMELDIIPPVFGLAGYGPLE